MTASRAAAMPSPQCAVLRSRFPATANDVSIQLARLHRAFDATGLRLSLQHDVTIVLGEVLNNIVEHAMTDIGAAWVILEVTREDGRLHVETTDRGRPLPPALLASVDLPEAKLPIDDLPEGGFGWFIIHTLTEDMVYERQNGINRLSFSFLEQADEG